MNTLQPTKQSESDERNEEEHAIEFNRPTPRTSRRLSLATCAVLLAIAVNVVLLGFIGYMDIGEKKSSEQPEQWSIRTVNLETRTHTPSAKHPEKKSRSHPENITPSQQTNPKNQPEPQVSMKPRPLQVNQIQTSLDLKQSQFRLRDLQTSVQQQESARQKRNATTNQKTSNSGKGNVFSSGELDQLPKMTSGPEPVYPAQARRNGEEGWVMLELDISSTGDVTRIQVLDWEGSPLFKESATEAVRNWSFEPGKVNGKAVRATGLKQRIRFQLVR